MKWISKNAFPLRIKRSGLAALMLLPLVLVALPALAAEQKSAKTTPASEAASAPVVRGPAAIPVADVATRAAEVSSLLQSLTTQLTHSEQIDTIEKALPAALAKSDQVTEETTSILQSGPALPTLQAQQQQWQQIQLKYSEWLATLTQRSKEIQDGLNRLTEFHKTWSLTLDAAKAAKAPDPSLQQINDTLVRLRNAMEPLNKQLSLVIDLQSQVGKEVTNSGTVLARITQIQQESMSGTLVRDSLPVWSPDLWADEMSTLPEQIRSTAASHWANIVSYFSKPSRRILLHFGNFVLLTLLFIAARHRVHCWTRAGQSLPTVTRIFDHPVAAALTLAMVVATAPTLSQLPATIRDTFQLLAVIPMIILLRSVTSASLTRGLYALGFLFTLDTLREIFSGEQLIGQVFLVVEALIGMTMTILVLRKLKSALGEAAESSRLHVLQAVFVLILLILSLGFASAAMGYVRLALLITPGLVAVGMLTLTLYASLQIFTGMVAIAFNMRPFRTLGMMQRHRALLERRLYHLLLFLAIGSLVLRYLSYLGLLAPTLSFGKAVLNAKLERGGLSITPGAIIEFILTVWAAFLLSAFIRFVLREDVYPRLQIPKGNSYAVSSLLHYIILAIGFTVAVAAIGVNLTKLTVLTGAFGIGLGFGLQGVVNNFVSGLILLFERPIHVGDTVEVATVVGNVRRIGIRASTVETVHGASVIVPNSQMVTDAVVNWTLNNRLRRIDLPVGVSYGAMPEKVIQTLENVALANPNIMRHPPPLALMIGYGDSAINFELRAWTDQFDNWPRIRSELAIAVYHAVTAAGMTFPFPQREVRLLQDIDQKQAVPG